MRQLHPLPHPLPPALTRARTLPGPILRSPWCLPRLVLAGLAVAAVAPAAAFNYVTDANGTWWGIQSAASPHVDNGSIRATQVAPAGQSGAYSTTINGFGGIKVLVQGGAVAPRFNGELMRGFGLQFDGVDRFETTRSVGLGGVLVSRSVHVNRSANWGRWLDTFTNTTAQPLVVQVAFGGQSGFGETGANASALVNTSNGDARVTVADVWATVVTPLAGSTLRGGPQVTVFGTSTPAQRSPGVAGNWLYRTFDNPLRTTGHDANFQAYVHALRLRPGESRSLLHFVVLGKRVDETTAPAERAAVEATATALAAAPALTGLSVAQVCSVWNFGAAAKAAAGFQVSQCPASAPVVVAQPPAPAAPEPVTSVRYEVFEKTIAQLRADLQSGATTAVDITQAYLDRIAAYDRGQFGFNSIQIVAADALEQARAADLARQRGASSPLLGIPIVVKNLFDTVDMATNNGSLTFDGFRPVKDAFQVARLRAAGAVIIGKAALEEYATSGSYSNDAFGQVWNVFNPSKSALASSGGSASALAASLAAAALGSQTGDSLYAPASAASLVTLRGTDGLQSGSGIMPLVWLTDFGGAMTRSVSDLADMLNAVAGTDPDDPTTAPADGLIPADWRSVLNSNALQGKRIGYIPAVWVDPFGTTGTVNASREALRFLEQAGATIVEMGQTVGGTDTPPVPPDATTGNLTAEGWAQYIDKHPELAAQNFPIATFVDVQCSQKKVPYVRAAASTCLDTPPPRMSQAQIDAKRAQRVLRQQSAKAWMDAAGVDAVVYPGLLSAVSLNDGGGNRSSFGRRDTPGGANGIPTVVVPAGLNDQGEPIAIQLMGRAWDDAKLVGYAYAFEQLANPAGSGHMVQRTAPPLRYEAGAPRTSAAHLASGNRASNGPGPTKRR